MVLASGCASTVQGRAGDGTDAGARDVAPGLNPDGSDPFRPLDGGVTFVDGSVGDTGVWQLGDIAVFDQRQASIYVGSYFDGAQENTYVSAEFRYVPRPDDPRCSVVAEGPWDLQRCTFEGNGPTDMHPRPFPQAGRLNFGGGTQAVVLAPANTGLYDPFLDGDLVFASTRTVRLVAQGSATVPAFTYDITMPPALDVTSPAGDTVALPAMGDFVVTWRPNTARTVYVTLTVQPQDMSQRFVRLNVEGYGNDGRAVVPASAIRALRAGGPIAGATLSVLPYNVTTRTIVGWPMTFTAVGQGRRFVVTSP